MRCLRIRVDDRLLHSEVIFGELGTPYCAEPHPTSFDHLIIASDLPWFESIETDQVPIGVRVTLARLEDAADHVVSDESTLMVVGTLTDLRVVLQSPIEPTEIVLANRADRVGTVCIGDTFHADRIELGSLKILVEQGLPIFVQRVPTSPPQSVDAALLSKLSADLERAREPEPPA